MVTNTRAIVYLTHKTVVFRKRISEQSDQNHELQI